MHEWSLAESVACAVADEIRRNDLIKLSRITIKIGELQQIDLDIFRFALEKVFVTYELIIGKENLILEIEPALLKCNVCGEEWHFREHMKYLQEDETEAVHFIPEIAHAYMKCPVCGSPDFNIKEGRGVWIQCIEGEKL